ncbi:MAG: tetratricopeptide repeat protein [Phycisphaerae bacterium]|nr:tetratricopeptide repeat protein [Phycisphaerae bacterium]
MKKFLHNACLALLAVGVFFSLNVRPCRAELDNTDLLLRETDSADESSSPPLLPGRETKIREKDLGENGYYVLYLPKDYTPRHTWPVLFCYHSLNEKPTVEPFRSVLKDRHFILVGLGYHQAGREGYDYIKTVDIDILKRALRSVNRRVRMDRELIFVGGYSKGAFYAASMLNNAPEISWAGGVLLGGGMNEPTRPKQPKSLYKIPIFLGCGREDPHLQHVQTAADHFKDMNSLVTLEVWPKTGHVETYPGSELGEWLIRNGPLHKASERLAKAKVHEKIGHPGLALEIYESLAHVDDGNVFCQQAGIAAKALSAKAQAKMDRASAAMDKKEYSLAQDLLAELAEEFKGSYVGNQAALRLHKLQSNPALQKELQQRQVKEQAEEIEKQALAAQKEGRHAEAIRLYEKYLWLYPKSDGAEDVKRQLKKLRSDDNLQKRLRDQKAARECRGWLTMADALLDQGKPDKAKTYLDKIIRKYPDTTWAVKARVRLRNMD